MDSETQAYFDKSLKRFSFSDKLKFKIRLMKLKNSDIERMKTVLIKEAKPIFSEFWLNRKDKDIINELSVCCFDERIMSLPKSSVAELYDNYVDFKNAKSKEAKEYMHNHLLTNLTLHYSIEGWFLKKTFQYARTGKL